MFYVGPPRAGWGGEFQVEQLVESFTNKKGERFSAENGNHTGQCTHAHDSNTWSRIQAHNAKTNVLKKKGCRNGRVGKRLAPNHLGGLVRRHPATPHLKMDKSNKPKLNHVLSTIAETSTYGNPDLRPRRQSYTVLQRGDDTDSTGSSLAISVHMETASSSDSDSSDTEEGGNHQGPHR